MQTTCENCYTVYDIPSEKAGLAGCPYCEHINKPKKRGALVQFGGNSEGGGADPAKTMLNYVATETKEAGSGVHKIQGQTASLSIDKVWVLTILEGDEKGKRFLLSKPTIHVGRKASDVILRDPEVSRQHCVIEIHGETATIRDLKSANGTTVNDLAIKEDLLKDQDRIRVGNTLLQISIQPKK
ncbi:MAG: FHA domain-containing protein [Candidatus Manganitrophaceae bacterium]